MFSRTYETMKEDNTSTWKKTKGNFFDKIMELLRLYCGYDNYSITRYTLYAAVSKKDEVYEIIAWYEKHGYLKTHSHALVCNIALVLLLISRKIPRAGLAPEGGFVALIHVMEEQTGLKMNSFYQENLALHAFIEGDEIHPDFLECRSWTEFILKNIKSFLPSIANENNEFMHPINLASLQQKRPYANELIKNYSKNIPSDVDEINLLLYSDRKEKTGGYFCYDLQDLFNAAVAQLPYEHLKYFFGLTLKAQAFSIAFNLFCIAEKLTKNNEESYHYNIGQGYLSVLGEILNTITKPVAAVWLVKFIEQGKTLHHFETEIDDYYLKLYSKKEFINDFNQVEEALMSSFQPNCYRLFMRALDKENKTVMEHWIRSNKMDLRNNKIISFNYSSDYSDSFYAFSFNAQKGISYTPLQALFLWASRTANCNLSLLYEVIELMIAQDWGCVSIRDNIGRSIGHYFDLMQRKHANSSYETVKENDLIIAKILNLLNQFYFSNEALVLFQCLKEFPLFSPYLLDLLPTISLFSKELSRIENNPIENKPIEPIEQFSSKFREGFFREAISYFCNFYKIRDITLDLKITEDNVLTEFCKLIEKPVHSSFILVMFDQIALGYKRREKDARSIGSWYNAPESSTGYITLCRKKSLIQNWRQVEIQFRNNFHPNRQTVFDSFIKNQLHSDIVSLLDEIMQNIIFDEKEHLQLKILLSYCVKTLKKGDLHLPISNQEANSLFASYSKLAKLPFSRFDTERDLKMIADYFEKLKKQYLFKKFGSFFYAREPKLPEPAMLEILDYSCMEV